METCMEKLPNWQRKCTDKVLSKKKHCLKFRKKMRSCIELLKSKHLMYSKRKKSTLNSNNSDPCGIFD